MVAEVPTIFDEGVAGAKDQHQGHDEIKFWLNVMHRRSIQDIEHINDLYDRVRRLERPWWKRVMHG